MNINEIMNETNSQEWPTQIAVEGPVPETNALMDDSASGDVASDRWFICKLLGVHALQEVLHPA